MYFIAANRQTCNQDGICAAVCPMNLIDFNHGEPPRPIAEAEDLCIRCGHCVAACPSASLNHVDIPLDQCLSVNTDLLLSEEQSEQFLRGRRSIRNYREQPVPREKLQKLIDIASSAPSGHNTQSAEWLVISDRTELDRLNGLVEVGPQ